MLNTPTVQELGTGRADVLAFRLGPDVESDDMEAMAEVVNRAFDDHAAINLLLVLEDFELTDIPAALSPEVARSMARAPAKVERYAVIGAPAVAAAMIKAMDPITPTEARPFDPEEAAAAWAFVGAEPSGVPPA